MLVGITPLKGSEEPQESFVVADIENEEDGRVLAIGLSHRNEAGEIEHEVFANWCEFINFVTRKREHEEKWARIWAHNGGGWDWCSLFQWLLQNKHLFPSMEIFPIIVQTKYVVLQVDFDVKYEEAENGTIVRSANSIRFCDSLFLLRSSLDELSRKFLGKGKVETGGVMAWDLFKSDKQRFYLYLRGDCENLLLILERVYETVREKICPLDHLGNTIGSTALRIFRTHYKGCITIPQDAKGHKELRQFLRDGYYGGRVEVFKYGFHPKVNVYDINSLYPFVMREHYYPVSPDTEKVSDFRKGVPGCYRIRFYQANQKIPAVLMQHGKSLYEGEGVFFSPEVELLKKVGGEVEVLEGYLFKHNKKIFEEFIDEMWALRLSDYHGPLGLICKFLMNSLYGKFCERPKDQKLILLNGNVNENIQKILLWQLSENKTRKEEGKRDLTVQILDEPRGVYMSVDPDAVCNNEHVGIGGLITSWARVELFKRFLATGLHNLVYCDTDSVHTLGKMESGKKLGDLKHEATGQGIYCGKKLYGIRWIDEKASESAQRVCWKEKLAAKGVSFCSPQNATPQKSILCFDDLVRIYGGKEYKAFFSQPATAKEVLKGSNPCQILRKSRWGSIQHNRKRTLRVTGK